MNRVINLLLVMTLLATIASARPQSRTTQKIYEKVDAFLVGVEYKAEMNFMGQTSDIEGRVLGISVKPAGTIIFDGTSLSDNSHFGIMSEGAPRVDRPKSITITDNKGNQYEAEYIGVDRYSSVAFARLSEEDRDKIPSAEFKDIDLKLGQELLLFWMLPENFNPRFQMATTVVTSIIDKPEKFFLTGELNRDFMMSPVVSSSGNMVGFIVPINQSNADYSPYDYGMVFGKPVGIMPYDRIRNLLDKPPEPGKFKRGWMGISLQALDPDVASFWDVEIAGGIIVSDVVPGSPADQAGLEAGDFVYAVDNRPLEITKDVSLAVFQKMVSELGAGGKLHLSGVRPRGEAVDSFTFDLILGEAPIPAGDAARYEEENFDLTIRDLVFSDYNNRNLDQGEINGVMVTKLEQGGWAAVGGIRHGDIIMKINDIEITSVEQGQEVFENLGEDKPPEIVFKTWRRHKTKFVYVKTHWE